MKEKEEGQTEQELVSEEEAASTEDTVAVEPEIVEDNDDEEDIDDIDEDDEEEDEEEPLSPEEQLKEDVKRLETSLLRAHADLENFKKRTARERQESIKYANKQIFLQMMDVMDNFERALVSVPDPKDNFAIGVKMIHKQLLDVFAENGVKPIEALHQAFDPYLHEALASEVTGEYPENTVIEEFQKGFRYHDKLLRPSKVKVAVPPEAEEEEKDDEAAETEE